MSDYSLLSEFALVGAQIVKLGARRHQRDVGMGVAAAQLTHAGQRAEAGAQHGDARRAAEGRHGAEPVPPTS